MTFYIKEWDRYTTAAKYINHLFRYLNRHWVKREMDEGKRNIYDVYTLHLVRWKEDLFLTVQESVMASVLRMVEKQRNGETIEQAQIKSIVDSFGTFLLGTRGEVRSGAREDVSLMWCKQSRSVWTSRIRPSQRWTSIATTLKDPS